MTGGGFFLIFNDNVNYEFEKFCSRVYLMATSKIFTFSAAILKIQAELTTSLGAAIYENNKDTPLSRKKLTSSPPFGWNYFPVAPAYRLVGLYSRSISQPIVPVTPALGPFCFLA
jgi:hypothetical protein